MSEAIREAFEAWHEENWFELHRGADLLNDGTYRLPAVQERWSIWQAALSGAQQGEAEPVAGIVQVADTCFKQILPWDEAQRQHASILSATEFLGATAEGAELIPLYAAPQPAQVPDELRAKALDLCAAVENENDLPPVKYSLKCGRLINELRAMLTAAPSPDHSGEADEVVGDLPGMWDQSDLSGGETDVRPPKHHTLKTDPAVFDRSAAGRKPWEIRLNDRDFQVGDTVTLQETVFSGEQMRKGASLGFTGKEINGQITYVLRGPKYGLADGWCVFSVETDHIADADKMVAMLSEIVDMWDGPRYALQMKPLIDRARTLLAGYEATPSVPENEIKARALEEYADQLDAVFANAREAGATDCPAWHAGQFAKDARKQAARLRTAGDEEEAV